MTHRRHVLETSSPLVILLSVLFVHPEAVFWKQQPTAPCRDNDAASLAVAAGMHGTPASSALTNHLKHAQHLPAQSLGSWMAATWSCGGRQACVAWDASANGTPSGGCLCRKRPSAPTRHPRRGAAHQAAQSGLLAQDEQQSALDVVPTTRSPPLLDLRSPPHRSVA